MTSPPSSLLFDKSVVRRIYEAQLRRSRGKLPTPLQIEAVEVFARLRSPAKQLYITEETSHVLQLRQPQLTKLVLNHTQALRKGRYLRGGPGD